MMCTGTTFALYAMAAAATVSAASSIHQGSQQNAWHKYQASQADADAKAEKSAAEVHAEKIRKMARRQAGEATAALAASGVDVGEGTSLNINKEIYADAEEDALMTIFGGADRALRGRAEAAGHRIKGRQAQQAGNVEAASTILSAYGKYANKNQATTGTKMTVGGG